MNYVRLGRGVGIGARLAGKALSKALEPAPVAAQVPTQEPTRAHSSAPQQAQGSAARHRPTFQQQSRAVARGTRKFGEAVWGPFAHAGRTLWLEVVGVFFGVFALFFGQQAWARRMQFAHGPQHNEFLALAAVCAMFVYLSATSFVRASRKSRKR
ncbi:MAG: hypothetical protein ACYCSN_03620 [Acidobacteriaceae bacterium]